MFSITKEFEFSASHQLEGLPAHHECSRLHGHNYRVEVVLESEELDEVGFVRDYRELAGFKYFLDAVLDHRHLNDVLPGINPTAENLARFLFGVAQHIAPEVVAVRVSETLKTWAEYREEPAPVVNLLIAMLDVTIEPECKKAPEMEPLPPFDPDALRTGIGYGNRLGVTSLS